MASGSLSERRKHGCRGHTARVHTEVTDGRVLRYESKSAIENREASNLKLVNLAYGLKTRLSEETPSKPKLMMIEMVADLSCGT